MTIETVYVGAFFIGSYALSVLLFLLCLAFSVGPVERGEHDLSRAERWLSSLPPRASRFLMTSRRDGRMPGPSWNALSSEWGKQTQSLARANWVLFAPARACAWIFFATTIFLTGVGALLAPQLGARLLLGGLAAMFLALLPLTASYELAHVRRRRRAPFTLQVTLALQQLVAKYAPVGRPPAATSGIAQDDLDDLEHLLVSRHTHGRGTANNLALTLWREGLSSVVRGFAGQRNLTPSGAAETAEMMQNHIERVAHLLARPARPRKLLIRRKQPQPVWRETRTTSTTRSAWLLTGIAGLGGLTLIALSYVIYEPALPDVLASIPWRDGVKLLPILLPAALLLARGVQRAMFGDPKR